VLLDRYGTVAGEIIAAIEQDASDTALVGAPAYSTGELRHLASTEGVVHLDDVLLRRTSLAFTGEASPETAREVAEAIAEALGWDAARVDAEVLRGIAAVHAADPAGSPAGTDAETRAAGIADTPAAR
jgi:glycerol-3-phosphate dehydrogenase